MGVELGTYINLQRSLLVTNAEATQTCRAGVRNQPPAEGGGQTTSERRCVLATTGPLPSHLRPKETQVLLNVSFKSPICNLIL